MREAGDNEAMTETWPDLAGRLTETGHVLPIRIYYEDTDFSRIVYHADYLKYMERGRSDYLRLLGFHHTKLAAGQFGAKITFAVRHMELDFRAPAYIDDVLEVRTRPMAIKGARLMLEQIVSRAGEVLVRGVVTIAVIDETGKPKRMPEMIRKAFEPI